LSSKSSRVGLSAQRIVAGLFEHGGAAVAAKASSCQEVVEAVVPAMHASLLARCSSSGSGNGAYKPLASPSERVCALLCCAVLDRQGANIYLSTNAVCTPGNQFLPMGSSSDYLAQSYAVINCAFR
jgi:hypothetical protein